LWCDPLSGVVLPGVGPPLVSALSHFYNPLSAISLSDTVQLFLLSMSTIPPWPSLPDAAWCCVAGRCVTKSIALNPPNEKSMITVAFQGKVPPPSSTEPPLTFSWVISRFSAHIYCIAHTPTGPCPNGRRFFPPPEEYRPFWCPVFYYCCHYRSCCGFCFPVSGFQTLTMPTPAPFLSFRRITPSIAPDAPDFLLLIGILLYVLV
jgi:hypothetical protein